VKLPLRHTLRPRRPKTPRVDATSDRFEQALYDDAFAEPIWRRPTPL
jgi:hypothetical protein